MSKATQSTSYLISLGERNIATAYWLSWHLLVIRDKKPHLYNEIKNYEKDSWSIMLEKLKKEYFPPHIEDWEIESWEQVFQNGDHHYRISPSQSTAVVIANIIDRTL